MLILAQLKKALDRWQGFFQSSRWVKITYYFNKNSIPAPQCCKRWPTFPFSDMDLFLQPPPPRFFSQTKQVGSHQAPPPSAETEAPVPKRPQARIHGPEWCLQFTNGVASGCSSEKLCCKNILKQQKTQDSIHKLQWRK